ncbi:MAG TPA: hypothetical protein V6C72_09485, partial [Chroococcales cyanobacterium]
MIFSCKRKRGSALVETAVGLILLIPVALFLVDVGAMVIVQTENDRLCKACARAAASGSDSGTAMNNAQQVWQAEQNKSFIQKVAITMPNWSTDTVEVHTQLRCLLPVPVPLMGTPSV